MSASHAHLLKLALPLISEHGFTRIALARSVLHLPTAQAHTEPLSDTAVSALFGQGTLARRALIGAWMDAGLESMRRGADASKSVSVKDALHARLEYNESVFAHLPEAFALLASPDSGIPPVDPLPTLKHAARVADEACYLSADQSLRLSWYLKRGSLIGVYSAAELHQLTSPQSAHAFLDSLLSASSAIESSVKDVEQFSSYVFRSWAGIIKSRDIL
ncbi:hypothetical protein B0H16DRAFT_1558221 [Mycena metata]|uniref:Ubiquinone biosynthesis protein n=1 Tax=Mycena metata TaxID=1033252 RepID=A0AAD7INA6_9AGAR|nr:hypothetical protein B0H16DRAFT_1558221 [Mycena metata]